MAGLLPINGSQNTQSSTPQTNSGGGILSALGIGGSTGFGGKPLFPTTPATAPKASNPSQNISTPSTTIAPKYQAPTNAPSQASILGASANDPASFNFLPGESPQAYNSRIAALTSGQGGGQTGGAGGGQIGSAPASNLAGATYSQQQTTQQRGASATGTGGVAAQYDSNGNPLYSTGANTATFPGILNQLAGTSAAGSGAGQVATGALIGASGNSYNQYTGQADNSYGNTNQLNSELQNTIQNAGLAQKANQSGFESPGVALGNQQVLENYYGAQENALSSALTANQGLYGTATTGQGNALSGFNSAAGAANTAQANTQSGLNQAGSLAAPTIGAQGSAFYNPADESTVGGLSPAQLQQYAQLYATGQQAGIPSAITGNPVLNAQVLAMAGQINPNFNVNTAAGQAQGQQESAAAPGTAAAQNTITGQTAAVNAGNSAYQQADPAYLKLANYTMPNIDGFGQLLTGGAGGVNPFASQYANMSLQQFQSQLSSAQQAQFQTTFQQLKQSIADLAGSGGSQTPTANSSQADATLSPTSKMSTIMATLQRIQQEGDIYLKSQGALNNAALSQTQGGGGASGGTGTFSDSSFYGS